MMPNLLQHFAPPTPLMFHVYIVESPDRGGWCCGGTLKQILDMIQIPSSHKQVSTPDDMQAALADPLQNALLHSCLIPPIIQIIAHGDQKGIFTTSDQPVCWATLEEWLRPINQSLGGNLLVCMASCEGLNGQNMVRNHRKPLPFMALIGNSRRVQPIEVTLGFGTFYHLLRKKRNIGYALYGMNIATENNAFEIIDGVSMQQAYLDELWQCWQLFLQQRSAASTLQAPCPL